MKSQLIEFLNDFFEKLERFPPGPGIVTYDRIQVEFGHSGNRLSLKGAIALARNSNEGAGPVLIRLVFELNHVDEGGLKPVQLEIKDRFYREEPGHLDTARENFKSMSLKLLEGFSEGRLVSEPFPEALAAGG